MIVYIEIMKRLSDNGWSSYRLRKEKLIGSATLDRIRNNESITTETIDVICRLCNCQPGDIMRFEKGE